MYRVVLNLTGYNFSGSDGQDYKKVTLTKKMMFKYWDEVQNVIGSIVDGSNEATEFSVEHIKENEEDENE